MLWQLGALLILHAAGHIGTSSKRACTPTLVSAWRCQPRGNAPGSSTGPGRGETLLAWGFVKRIHFFAKEGEDCAMAVFLQHTRPQRGSSKPYGESAIFSSPVYARIISLTSSIFLMIDCVDQLLLRGFGGHSSLFAALVNIGLCAAFIATTSEPRAIARTDCSSPNTLAELRAYDDGTGPYQMLKACCELAIVGTIVFDFSAIWRACISQGHM